MQKSAIKSWTLMWQQQQNGHAQREKHFGQKYMHVFQNKYVTWPKQYTLLSIVPSPPILMPMPGSGKLFLSQILHASIRILQLAKELL